MSIVVSGLAVFAGYGSASPGGHWVLTDIGAQADRAFPDYTGLALVALTRNDRVLWTARHRDGDGLHFDVFQWQNGHVSDLGPLPLDMSGGGSNSGGAIVGASHDPPYCPVYGPAAPGCKSGPSHAYLWRPGYATPLGTLGGESSGAWAINDHGQIVGSSQTARGVHHAFLWQDGRMIDISPPGMLRGEAFAINNRGQVLIDAQFRKTAASYLWQRGKLTGLSAPGVDLSALQINERGEVIGASYKRNWNRSHVFFWRQGTTIDLGPSFNPDGLINGRGEVVISRVSEHTARAILWQNGVFRDIGNLGGPETYAAAINDQGDIVGTSLLAPPTHWTLKGGAFFWRDGKMTALPGSPNFFETPMEVDDTGTHVVLGTPPNTCVSTTDCDGEILLWTYEP